MTDNKLKFGVCLYSFAKYFHSGELNLEGLVEKAKKIGYTGITMVAAQHCDEYPYPTDKWLYNFRDMLEKHEIEPLCWEAYIDVGMRNDRDLTSDEIAEFTRNDLIYANKAGFKMVKTQHSITPKVFESMIPLCEKLEVKLCIEMHHPHHPLVPVWRDEYFKLMEKSDGWLGIVPDTSIFQKYPSVLHIREAYKLGCRKEMIEQILQFKRNGNPESDIDKLDLTSMEREYACMFYEKFNAPTEISQLEPMLKYTPMIHGKFYYLEDDCHDPCIPFDEIIPVLKKAGYNRHIVAEYEGHHMTGSEDEGVQLTRFYNLVKRLYDEA